MEFIIFNRTFLLVYLVISYLLFGLFSMLSLVFWVSEIKYKLKTIKKFKNHNENLIFSFKNLWLIIGIFFGMFSVQQLIILITVLKG